MIPENSSGVIVEGQLSGEEIPMNIDPENFIHVMDVLTNAYSDNILAFIREYATNGHDEHIKVGQDRPIEITLPTELSLFYRVKDFGTGLSKEDIRTVYALYGASTKRGSNDFNGMLGIGCKSGLAYTSQFTVSAVKDGQACTVVVAKDDERGGVMTVLNEYATDEPNSVEVSIPVDETDVREVETTAREFFRAWKLGTVRINGEYPEPYDGIRITDNILLSADDHYEDRIVMGNVAYPQRLHFDGRPDGYNLVAYVGIGEVMMARDREKLRKGHDQTNATLERIIQDYKANKDQAVQRIVDQAKDRAEAITLATTYKDKLYTSKMANYQGVDIPAQYEHPPLKSERDNRFTVTRSASTKLSEAKKQRSLTVGIWPKAVFVTGYDRDSFTPTQKKKLLKWATDNGLYSESYRGHGFVDGAEGIEYFILFQEKHAPKQIRQWITDKARYVKWETIEAIKLPRPTRTGSGRQPGSYDAYDAGVWTEDILAEDLDTKNGIFYSLGKETAYDAWQRLKHFYPNATLVELAHNRVAKFQRLFPQARGWREPIQEQATKFAESLTPKQRLAIYVDEYYIKNQFGSLLSRKVDDPDLKRWIRAINYDTTEIRAQITKFKGFLPRLNDEARENPLAKYPLYNSDLLDSDANHLYTYLNAAYAAMKGTSK